MIPTNCIKRGRHSIKVIFDEYQPVLEVFNDNIRGLLLLKKRKNLNRDYENWGRLQGQSKTAWELLFEYVLKSSNFLFSFQLYNEPP